MTTPPQGPWGPGQPGGQSGGQQGGQGGQGGWGQQPPGQGGGWGQRPQQPQQPPQQGQSPQQGQPPQQGGGWGQQQPGRPQPGQPAHGQPGQPGPGQGQPGQGQQPAQGGWGQRSPQQGGSSYQQQPWSQQGSQQQGGWHQQQGQPQWQPQGGGSKGPGGIGKDKLPLLIGGGVVGIVLIGLLVFLGVKALGGDDEPEAGPTTSQSTEPTGEPTSEPSNGGDNGSLGNASGQAKTATEKLQKDGYQCSDLFNTGQGAHRGCFKYDGPTEAEAIFQFQPDGTIIGVLLLSKNRENVNNAGVTFDAALQAIGNDTFGGSEVKKIQDAVKTGQKSQKVGSTWGEFELQYSGDRVELTGGKSGSDSFDLPRKAFDTTQDQLVAALKAKRYVCTTSCSKKVGKYGTQRIYSHGNKGEGIRRFEMSVSGEPEDVKAALPAAVSDAFGAIKGADIAALKSYVQAHNDGKAYSAYVAGWRVDIVANNSGSYSSSRISIDYESFYV